MATQQSSSITWESWKHEYGKRYSEAEDAEKKRVWEATLAKVTAHNLKYVQGLVSYRLGMNKFAVEGPKPNPALDENETEEIIKVKKRLVGTSGRVRSPKRQAHSSEKLPGSPTPKKSRLQSPENVSRPRRSQRLAKPTPGPSK